MKKFTKRTKSYIDIVDKSKEYSIAEAIEILKKASKTKFDESIDISMKLNVKPKELTQPIRGSVALPNGTGKKVSVCAICKEDEKKAKDAGADHAGADELIAKIAGGWTDFDVAVATPEMMKFMAKLGKVLGPKGMMPNPKSGTVTTDIEKTIKEIKAGKIEYKMDKQAGVHVSIGRVSFSNESIIENANEFLKTIISSHGTLQKPNVLQSIYMAKTMGPGVSLDLNQFRR